MPCLLQPHLRKPCPRGLQHGTQHRAHPLPSQQFYATQWIHQISRLPWKATSSPLITLRRPVSSTFQHSQVSAFLPPLKEVAWGQWTGPGICEKNTLGKGRLPLQGCQSSRRLQPLKGTCTWYPAKQAVGGDAHPVPSSLAEPPSPRSHTMSRKRGGHCSSWATTQPAWEETRLPPASLHTEYKLHFCYSYIIQPWGPPHVF